MTTATREQMQQESLTRAVSGQSLTNWPVIVAGFVAKGIPESDILPRENVFTYNAWRALGRQVRRGEHGVKVTTFVSTKAKDRDEAAETDPAKPRRQTSRPWSATVFHVSQTDPIKA
jgi:hypothetical protein